MGACGSDQGRVMDGWRLWGAILFAHVTRAKSCSRNQYLEKYTHRYPSGWRFLFFDQFIGGETYCPLATKEADFNQACYRRAFFSANLIFIVK